MNLSTVLLVLICLSTSSLASKCHCQKASEQESTHWGWQKVILKGESFTRRIHGQVLDPLDQPLIEVLVEVLTDPDILLMEPSPDREKREGKQRRIAACKSDKDGKFCFTNLRAGRYELRCSKTGFDAPQMIVVVTRRTDWRLGPSLTIILPVSK
jgi:hypothetical protein